MVDLNYAVTFFWQFLLHVANYTESLQREGVEVVYPPFIIHPRRYLRKFGKSYDIVILTRLDLAAWLIDDVRRYAPNSKIVFDTVDLTYLREIRAAEIKKDPTARAAALKRKATELDVVRKSDYTLVVSPVEQELLSVEVPEANVRVISTIHSVPGCAKPFAQRRDILFIGSFLHTPNVDAAIFLIEQIMPRIASALPNVKLYVVGMSPPIEIQRCASNRVIVTGHVPDAISYFQDCRVSVAPIRYGAGVKGKVNTSMSHGLPVVVTTIAAEGMYLEDQTNALIADEPIAFADAVIRLYHDADLWNRLSANGLAQIDQHFGVAKAKTALSKLLSEALHRDPMFPAGSHLQG